MVVDVSDETDDAPLSREEKEQIFRIATRGFERHYREQIAKGMTNGELWRVLQESLGIFGGSGGPDQPSVTYRGAGLKIWGGRTTVNHVTTAPLFSYQATVDMAREVYGIPDTSDPQMLLL